MEEPQANLMCPGGGVSLAGINRSKNPNLAAQEDLHYGFHHRTLKITRIQGGGSSFDPGAQVMPYRVTDTW